MRRAAGALVVLLAFAAPWAGCSQTASTVLVRSLERSGRATFLCLHDRTSNTPGEQLDSCFTPGQPYPPENYIVPHVIALVTQTARGEVAVVDVTAQAVLDADPTVPGFNFLPIGALPTDIVATPGSNASFVAIGDPQRPGIFAIPSSRLPYQVGSKVSSLGSWPACFLDAVPTELVVVPDLTKSHPGRCAPGSEETPAPPGYDLGLEQELYGRLKIIATLPDRGELVVIDAQELLARPLGSFDRCPIEQTLVLGALLPGATPADAGLVQSDAEAGSSVADASPAAADGASPSDSSIATDAIAPDGAASPSDATGASDAAADASTIDAATCSGRVTASPTPSLSPHPVSMALADDGRLFVSDDRASVIHVVDVTDPCAISEKPPLLPFSAAAPTRTVLTKSIAVSPLTSDKKRFVYAVDYKANGSLMVFDVSSGSTERRPLVRPDLLHTPYEQPDRIAFASPVESLTFATHDYPLGAIPPNGVVPRGVKCDPTVSDATNPAYAYRPPDGFVGLGAGPSRLRGTFAFAALSNGHLAVVDVDDFDAACRRPAASDDDALGCAGTIIDLDATHTLPSASTEASCKVVEPHRPRSSQYFVNSTAGQHAPALQGFPLLYDKEGTVLTTDPARPESAQRPKLLGPSLAGKSAPTRALMAGVAGSDAVPEDGTNVLTSDPTKARNNWVAFDLREPRSQYAQTWFVTYEGVIPPFNGRKGLLRCLTSKPTIECEGGSDPSAFVLFDSSVGFCDQGAQGIEIAMSMGLPSGDIVQILEELPDPADPYWSTVGGVCSRASCESAYGAAANPTSARDLGVDSAFQDRLVLAANPNRGNQTPLACCFPYPVTYTVRAGKHWIVTGSVIGYAHHVIPDPTAASVSNARCILSCDQNLELRTSRVVGLDPFTPSAAQPLPKFDDKRVFRTPQIQLVVWNPAMPPNVCPNQPSCPLVRDMSFQFTETGGFIPIEVALSPGAVLAQSIRFVRGIDQLAVPDAASQGLLLFDLNALSTNGVRAFY